MPGAGIGRASLHLAQCLPHKHLTLIVSTEHLLTTMTFLPQKISKAISPGWILSVESRMLRTLSSRGFMCPLQDFVADFVLDPEQCPAGASFYPTPLSAHSLRWVGGPSLNLTQNQQQKAPGHRPNLQLGSVYHRGQATHRQQASPLPGPHWLLGNYILCSAAVGLDCIRPSGSSIWSSSEVYATKKHSQRKRLVIQQVKGPQRSQCHYD